MKPITEALYARRGDAPYRPVITAHSGCEKTPDNSIEHIRTALASGAEMLEIDVRLSDAGVLCLTHNALDDYSACPTLAECFELTAAHPSACINCDVKTFGLTAPVIELAKRYGMESRILFTGSVAPDERPLLDASASDWWLSLWRSDHEPEELAAACETFRASGDAYRIVNLDQNMVSEDVIRTVREHGYMLSVWTVNSEDRLRSLMQTGAVANITTRIPGAALRIRAELFGEN